MKITFNCKGYLQVPVMLKGVLQESIIFQKGDCQQCFSKWQGGWNCCVLQLRVLFEGDKLDWMFWHTVTDSIEQNPSSEVESHSASREISKPLWKYMFISMVWQCFAFKISVPYRKLFAQFLHFPLSKSLFHCESVTVYRYLQHRKKRTVTWKRLLNSQHHWLHPLRILMLVAFTVPHLNHQLVNVYRST